MAAHQPEALGLPFQRAIRTFLKGLPNNGNVMAAGRLKKNRA
ncbi:hypothetical protein AAE485_09350 [Acidithiobacillus ferriphilus]